jgi:hypothetical protein
MPDHGLVPARSAGPRGMGLGMGGRPREPTLTEGWVGARADSQIVILELLPDSNDKSKIMS